MALWPRSSVAKKFFNGLTGLGLTLFIIVHLAGNLLLLTGNPDDFNRYAHKLESLGPLLWLAEIGLALFFVVHILSALTVYFDKQRARPTPYAVSGNAGGASRKTISSQTMIITGLVLLVFVPWHVASLKFGPGVEEGYVTVVDGLLVRDLHSWVIEYFQNPVHVALYVLVMLLLGFHVRHGFWSMIQTLGAYHPRWTPLWYTGGLVFAVVMAVGFLVIPIWIYVNGAKI
ncbi:MAG: succinate dehydrogenase cytochrome b subunit [Candidatus Bipolaricaulota bacterium]|nr:succinate dehydrogenase cytochrome b subunit [Candidatus Bipolaricaulota bacterium]